MSFLYPIFLYVMLPIIFILFYFIITQKEHKFTFFSDEVLEKLTIASNTLSLRFRNGLFFLIMILITFALAQPVIHDGKVKIEAKSADVMIALDISNSMLAEDVYPTRLKSAQKKIIEFLDFSEVERIGVMAFAKDAYLVSPLSFDHRAVKFLTKQLHPSAMTEKGTNFMQLLDVSAKMMRENENKYLFIFTDGGDQEDFEEEIDFAKEQNIKVFVLGLGTTKGAPIKTENGFIEYQGNIVITKLNENVAKLATQTDGAYIQSVHSDKDVKAMLKEIKSKTIQKSLKEEEITKFIPLFYYPTGLALLLLMIATSSMSKRHQVDLPSALLLGLLLFSPQSAEAVFFDFMTLDKAKTSYKNGEYNEAQKHYKEYNSNHNSNDALYNQASSLYKSGDFNASVNILSKMRSTDEDLEFKRLHNLGNAHTKLMETPELEKAVKAYESALKIQEDKETKENLELVKAELEKRKKEQEQKDEKKNKDKKDQDKKDQDEQKKEDKEKKDQNKKDDQENQEKSDKKKSDDKSDKEKNEKDDAQSEKKNDEDKMKEDKKPESQKSDKEKKEDKESQEQQPQDIKEIKMSDAEAKKWLKELNKNQSAHIYKLQPTKQQRPDNEKPW